MYISLLHLPLLKFAYLFFLSFPLNVFVSFVFIALFPSWHLALVLFSSLCSNQFCSGRYNFWFPLFLCQVNLLYFIFVGLFWFCLCVYMYIVYSVTLFIVVINLCHYVGLLQFCGVFLLFWFVFSFFLSSSFFSSFL